jgi:hypothetical protein
VQVAHVDRLGAGAARLEATAEGLAGQEVLDERLIAQSGNGLFYQHGGGRAARKMYAVRRPARARRRVRAFHRSGAALESLARRPVT